MTAHIHMQKAAVAGLMLLALSGAIFNTTIQVAMGAEFVVARITGTAPITAPVLHLPTGFMREGQVLRMGDEYLFLAETTVVFADMETGDFYTVNGSNRIRVEKEGLTANAPAGLIRHEKFFFTDPQSAVPRISDLLVDENWLELALYYDLSGTEVTPASLLSGAFFQRDNPPEVSHPGGFDRFKQPFPPQFSYGSHFTVSDDVVRVIVQISIDQGGGMVQEGRSGFAMRKSARGYQLLSKDDPAAGDGSITPPALPVTE